MSDEPMDATRVKPHAKVGDRPPARGWRRIVNLNALGILLVVAACVASLYQVLSIRHQIDDPNIKTIRIAHWQLEAGYRDALQSVIDDYCRLHPDVRIIQAGITERVYPQWLNVNLIADNAPDLAELGKARLSEQGEAIAKYFMPLGQEIAKPNPYNADPYLDELESTDPALRRHLSTAAWRDTLSDGMRGGYQQDLQDYYSIPTSFFTVRIFYNRSLLTQALGSGEPPATLKQLLDSCERLRAWARREGRRFYPIAGTGGSRGMLISPYRVTFTYRFADATDIDLNGDISSMESWAAFHSGKASFSDPAIRAYFEVVRAICSYFNPQFMAMDRDQAIADFAQGGAAFYATGSWDATSLFQVCHFDVGVMAFPIPAPGEPYSEYGIYGVNEAGTAGAGKFGITKTSKHPEVALDFLRFLSSHKWNQKLNRGAGWLPVTVGTTPAPNMRPFMPNPYGVSANLGFGDGYDLGIKVEGAIGRYLGGEIGYDTLITAVKEAMASTVIGFDRIWFKTHERQREQVRSLERTIAVQTSRLLMGTAAPGTDRRVRETILDQALSNDGGVLRHQYRRQIGKTFPEQP